MIDMESETERSSKFSAVMADQKGIVAVKGDGQIDISLPAPPSAGHCLLSLYAL